jgi:hypothetical protein
MGVSLDLRKAHHSRIHGDIVAVQTWVNDERSLVLLPANRKDAGWYILGESAAWKWNINAIDAGERASVLAHADTQAHIACSMLGIEPSLKNRARIVNIITDTIPDLVRMPSSPEQEMIDATFGEIKVMADGKLIGGDEVRVEKSTGATYG